jgi:hypothetical protein
MYNTAEQTKELVAKARAASKAERNEKQGDDIKPNSLFGHVDYEKSQKLRPTEEQIRTMKRRLLRQYKQIKEANPRAYTKDIFYETGDNTPESSPSSNNESWMYRTKPKKYVPRSMMRLIPVYQPNYVNNARTRRRQIQSKRNFKRESATQKEKMLKRIQRHIVKSNRNSKRANERRANKSSKLWSRRRNSVKLKTPGASENLVAENM